MLGAVAMAQQDEEQGKKKKSQQTDQTQAQSKTSTGAQAGTQAQHGKAAGKHEEHASASANTPAGSGNASVNTTQQGAKHKGKATTHDEAASNANTSANASANEGTGKNKNKRAAHNEAVSSATGSENASVNEGAGKNKNKRAAHNEAEMKGTNPNPAATAGTAEASGTGKGKAGTVGKNGKTVDVQKIKAAHASFRAEPKPEKIKTVTFNQNYRIVGAERWTGPQYEVFRAYQPAWHDAGWYQSNFGQVAVFGGGAYYFNSGYWYPAWGYDSAAQYYPYDGPIYVGARSQPPDQVIANVQAELQEQGYYTGEVDGLLGPLTRQALTAYQADHGLYTTAAIDEPTLDAMGLS